MQKHEQLKEEKKCTQNFATHFAACDTKQN